MGICPDNGKGSSLHRAKIIAPRLWSQRSVDHSFDCTAADSHSSITACSVQLTKKLLTIVSTPERSSPKTMARNISTSSSCKWLIRASISVPRAKALITSTAMLTYHVAGKTVTWSIRPWSHDLSVGRRIFRHWNSRNVIASEQEFPRTGVTCTALRYLT